MKNYETVILISVKDNLEGLLNTVNSITEIIDILICDDGSKEVVKLKEFKKNITIIRNEKNKGIGYSLNRLINIAIKKKYKYVMIIDAGDLYVEGRLRKQIDYAKLFPDVVLFGGSMIIQDESGNKLGDFNAPIDKKNLDYQVKRGYPFAHPTALYNLNNYIKLNIKYNEKIKASLDYDLIYRLYNLNSNYIKNLNEVLCIYIREKNSIGVKSTSLQAKEAMKIRWKYADYSWDGIAGRFDIRLIIRFLYPKLFFFLSKHYQTWK